ncbi:MAG: AarF/UbiB family protein, partial [Pseudomonadota bacterium]|nr:AarF/UbiB family protein [Pseudomonadota bacterium]
MAFSLKPQHLKRYKDIAVLLLKHGRRELLHGTNLDEALLHDHVRMAAHGEGKPEQLAHDLENLGPTFIKLGQMLATRADLLPQVYLDALARLQDNVEPFPYAEVEKIVVRELGVRISKAYKSFNPKPIAAASLGQVHLAQLRTGRAVAVKVQRPGIRQIILDDFEVLDEIILSIDRHTRVGQQYAFRDMLDNFHKTLLRELDYRQEAANMILLGRNLARYPRIVVPQPVADYTTSRVLTMDYISGSKITALTPLARIEHNTDELAETLYKAYLDQVLVDGFFHADPHPGNVFITREGQLALIDLGMVAHID